MTTVIIEESAQAFFAPAPHKAVIATPTKAHQRSRSWHLFDGFKLLFLSVAIGGIAVSICLLFASLVMFYWLDSIEILFATSVPHEELPFFMIGLGVLLLSIAAVMHILDREPHAALDWQLGVIKQQWGHAWAEPRQSLDLGKHPQAIIGIIIASVLASPAVLFIICL